MLRQQTTITAIRLRIRTSMQAILSLRTPRKRQDAILGTSLPTQEYHRHYALSSLVRDAHHHSPQVPIIILTSNLQVPVYTAMQVALLSAMTAAWPVPSKGIGTATGVVILYL